MLVPISKAAKPTLMTTANSAHNEQLEIIHTVVHSPM